jgi:hypothetical protein
LPYLLNQQIGLVFQLTKFMVEHNLLWVTPHHS